MNEIVAKTNRVIWLDACKVFAIILVAIGHILGGYLGSGLFTGYTPIIKYTYELIYSFHMPLFFILSGYVFHTAYFKNILKSKARLAIQIMNNIYIYILWSCIQWFIKALFAADVNVKFTRTDLFLILIKPMDPYWFIYILILYYIFFAFLKN